MSKIKHSRKTKALLLAVIFLMLGINFLSAQNAKRHIITGKVTVGAAGNPVAGATIMVKGTKNIVSSQDNGDFNIIAQPGDVIVISFVGYKSKEINIGDKTDQLTINLSEDFSNLQDVIVVGYGKTKKSDLSSAVGTISNTDLNKTVNVTLDEALQGKAANLYVAQTSGQPGAGASVIIRGVSTVTGNYQPLYVIDGVQIRPGVPTGGTYNLPAGFANELQG
ncbi:MAG TPA: carboxypeptidase-like regulatory domain-containing protein, partial [Parafilimonas sp.]|nr:carboxypeptidase-like regulatory domain-containing protein [Parafilimonas sp.]